MAGLSESHVEEATLEWLAELGYAVLHGPDISPDGPTPERVSHDQVLLNVRLREALGRLNPNLPAETLEEVLRKVQADRDPLAHRREPPPPPLSHRGRADRGRP